MNTLKKLDQSVFQNAPEWVRWAAVDSSGYAFFYEVKPAARDNWEWRQPQKAHCRAIGLDFTTSGWKNSLIERKGGQS